ncbi:MAG: hypothetical protein OIF55_03805 [Amphritea sp.]|nr:hypothetical protein [Amphritea sp.]
MRSLYAFLFASLIGITTPAQAEVRLGLHGTIDLGNNVYLTISTPRLYHGHRYYHKPYYSHRHKPRHHYHHGYYKKHHGYHKKHHGYRYRHHDRGHHYGHRGHKPRHYRSHSSSRYIIVRDPQRHDYRRYRHQRQYRY